MHFENLKIEFYDGVISTVEEDAKDGFERLKKVLDLAKKLQINNNPLVGNMTQKDRQGIIHHLANEREDVVWRK